MKSFIAICLLFLLTLPAWGQGMVEKEVTLQFKDAQGRKVTLAGTFTTPAGKAPKGGWPAVVFVTGSGPENRDEEVFGFKPFQVIAHRLAQDGVASLRCDDRGVGGSTGVFDDVTPYDLAADVSRQWTWLRGRRHINANKVGLIGHSEGGLLALMAAADQPKVACVLMLAGPGNTMRKTLMDQNQAIFSLRGVPDSLVARRLAFMQDVFHAVDSIGALRAAHPADSIPLVKEFNLTFRQLVKHHNADLTKEQKQLVGLTGPECYSWAMIMAQPYMMSILNLDPADYIVRLHCRLGAYNGSLDCQVDADSNLNRIKLVCKENGIPFVVNFIKQHNHLFQKCETGAVEEYERLGQAPSEQVLEYISHFIQTELSVDKDSSLTADK